MTTATAPAIDMDRLGREVAQALGPEWSSLYDPTRDWVVTLRRSDGAHLDLRRYRHRIIISGDGPEGIRWGAYGYPPHEITVAEDRTPAIMAREITRRYLPAYTAWYARATERTAIAQRNHEYTSALLVSLTDVLGAVRANGNHQYAYHSFPSAIVAPVGIWVPEDTHVKISVNGGVSIEIIGAAPDLASALVSTIRDYADRTRIDRA